MTRTISNRHGISSTPNISEMGPNEKSESSHTLGHDVLSIYPVDLILNHKLLKYKVTTEGDDGVPKMD